MTNYYIAFFDKDGKGFGDNNLPYLFDPCSEKYGIKEVYDKAILFRRLGYKQVTIFCVEDKLPLGDIDWEYIEKHKVEY